MANKNHFSKPFDDGTKAKLEIFKNYLTEWLPTFISKNENVYWDNIFIYDFFSGEGKDSNGCLGSPLIILEVLNDFNELVEKSSVKIKVILNEMDKTRYETLSQNVNAFNYNKEKITVEIYNEPFQNLFNRIYPIMIKTSHLPRIMFLDQFGIKEITNEIFGKLISFKRTDFIFFISSSFVRRFNELPEFGNYLKIEKEKFEESTPFHSHKVIFNYYKSLINTDYKIAPFSIKKGKNIYGLIFGSNHTLGLEKFLKVGWKINPHTGDANYNIDEEKVVDGLLSLWDEDNTIKKIGFLHNKLNEIIISKKCISLHELYIKTLEFGCLPKHCNELLKKLEKEKKIEPIKTRTEKIHTLATSNLTIKLL